jgi:hypothetical protein
VAVCGLSGVLRKRSCQVSTEVGCCLILRYSTIVDGVLNAQVEVVMVVQGSGPDMESRSSIGDHVLEFRYIGRQVGIVGWY